MILMSAQGRTRMRLLKCPLWTRVSNRDLSFLEGLPNRRMPVDPDVCCELEVGHSGRPHCALVQVAESGDFFAYWVDDAEPEIRRAAVCPHTGLIEDEELTCLLPRLHWGAHRFELEAH